MKYLKFFCIKMALVALCIYMAAGGLYFGWYAFGFREGAIATWLMLVVLPLALAPYILFDPLRRRSGA